MGAKYRLKAADLYAKARDQIDPSMRAHFESLALSYLRLADQADRRGAYEHPAQTDPARPAQQQQQPQKKPGSDGTG